VQGVHTHPQKFSFVENFGKISKNMVKDVLIFFSNLNEFMLLCYRMHKQKFIMS